MKQSKQRTEYLDYLRVIATYAVVVLHCAGYKESLDVGSMQWWVSIAYNTMVRWAVPVFCMISGALFLSRDTVACIGQCHYLELDICTH